jgi:hypothetical protein
MPRIVSADEKAHAIKLMTVDNLPQREIERKTGLSRPFLRKLSRQVSYQFPRNGVELVGKLCMCANCGTMFNRAASKVERAKNQFCDTECKLAFMKGPNHPAWKTGASAKSFSSFIKNLAGYEKFRQAVIERDGGKCVISGRTDNLDVHHIEFKREGFSPEKALLC